MADFKNKIIFKEEPKTRGPRSNNQDLHLHEVQVISSSGENLGILNTSEAI